MHNLSMELKRLCTACRQFRPRSDLLRLTVNHVTGEVLLNVSQGGSHSVHGRSVYICPRKSCVDQAFKGTRLKSALEGGRGRKDRPRRKVNWPLESQLMHTLTSMCTET